MVAGFEAGDVRAGFEDDAGAVAPGDVGEVEVDAGEAVAGPDVEVVEGGSFDIDEDF